MVRVAIFLLLFVSYLAPHLDGAEATAIPWQKDIAVAKQQMDQQKKPMLLFLTMPGCTYCDKMKSQTFSQQWIREQVSTKYVPVQLNGKAHPQLARRLKVRVYPTTAVVTPDGRLLEVMHGYRSPAEFVKHMAIAQSKLTMKVAASLPLKEVN